MLICIFKYKCIIFVLLRNNKKEIEIDIFYRYKKLTLS